MEFRVLQYFLAVAREQSISAAARSLHLSQPTLSRQLKEMEDELGKKLFIRSSRKIILTEEGLLLRKRGEEILELMQKTQDEIRLSDESLAGDIRIGAGETEGMRFLLKSVRQLRQEHPLIHVHIISGDKSSVLEDLDHGLIDFALLFGEMDRLRYDSIVLPHTDRFGILMRKDDPLALQSEISPTDLQDKPLILSRQFLRDHDLIPIFGQDESHLNIVGTYNLLFNGSLMVDEGMGYAVCLDRIINTEGSRLCFRPLSVEICPEMSLVWKKYQLFSKAAEQFLLTVQGNLIS